MRIITSLILAAFFVSASPHLKAQGFLDGEYLGQTVSLTPQAPTSDDQLVFRFVKPTGVSNSAFDARISGQTIQLLAIAVDTNYQGPDITYDVIVGPLPAGSYAVEVHLLIAGRPPNPSPATLIDSAQLQITQGVSSAVRVMLESGVRGG